MRSRTH